LRLEKETQADPEDAGLGTVPGGASSAPGPVGLPPASQQPDLPETEKAAAVTERKPSRTGRNLPAAIGVGLLMGGLVVLTLFTVKATFLLYVGIIVAIALWELSAALRSRDIHLPLVPIVTGGIAMVTLAYWTQAKWALGALGIAAIGVLAWRLQGGAAGYVRDVTAGIFTLIYLPLAAVFVALMVVEPDGSHRAFIFVVLTVCSDTGGYLAGILIGKHLMVPVISPKKTWEGLGGSAVFCLAAGAFLMPALIGGHLWQGILLGAAAVAASTIGDLVESMIKRDLEIKDMGHLLPGHGGVMERLDSLLVMAPVVWVLLAVFVPNGHTT
jgi:phosphatidate cytidylyltransferase